jgi:hypothetical protein
MLPRVEMELLIKTIVDAITVPLEAENLINAVKPGSWNRIVLLSTSYANAIPPIVRAAEAEGWLRELVDSLAKRYPGRPEFRFLLA